MKWQDQGYILSAKKHGERSQIISVFTPNHGRHAGLWRGSGKTQSNIQIGSLVQCSWSARLPEHLGMWQLEVINAPIGRLFQDLPRLLALTSLTTLIDQLLPERHPYSHLYQQFSTFITTRIWGDDWVTAYVSYEFTLLEQLGFGLDLQHCAVTGQSHDLVYVSPKTGRAVSVAGGEPYKDRLLPLPQSLLTQGTVSQSDIIPALRLSGYFLQQHLANKGLPQQRQQLLQCFGK